MNVRMQRQKEAGQLSVCSGVLHAAECMLALAFAGINREAGLATPFWDLFETPERTRGSEVEQEWRAAAAAGKAFAVHEVGVRCDEAARKSGASSASTALPRQFSLMFRCRSLGDALARV